MALRVSLSVLYGRFLKFRTQVPGAKGGKVTLVICKCFALFLLTAMAGYRPLSPNWPIFPGHGKVK